MSTSQRVDPAVENVVVCSCVIRVNTFASGGRGSYRSMIIAKGTDALTVATVCIARTSMAGRVRAAQTRYQLFVDASGVAPGSQADPTPRFHGSDSACFFQPSHQAGVASVSLHVYREYSRFQVNVGNHTDCLQVSLGVVVQGKPM